MTNPHSTHTENTVKNTGNNTIPASTVVVFRHGSTGQPAEILMVTRSRAMKFAGGAAVFPGGRVDEADFIFARSLSEHSPEQLSNECDVEEIAHRIAAIRETLEETGLVIGINGAVDADKARAARKLLLEQKELAPVLDAMGWRLDLSAILPFARWFPKNENLPRVFDTRFFIADLGTGAVDITVDATENTKLYWITAQNALDAADRNDLSIIFPTRRNLERLAQFQNFEQAADDCAKHPVKTIIPYMEMREGKRWLCIDADAGYPVTGEPLENVTRG